MKKLFAIIIAFALIFTLCSCKTEEELASNNSSYIENVQSSETSNITTESEETDVSSKIETNDETASNISSNTQSTVSNNTSNESEVVSKNENVSSDDSKIENNSSDTSGNNNIPTQDGPVYITADTSRAESTDVGSIISKGYIYYTNPTTAFSDGLFRKKIAGGSEETVTNLSVTEYSVLNETVYYIHQFNLYRCNTDGSNVKKLYDNISNFVVAGDWIFAIRSLGTNSFTHKPIQELYIISTDGSVVKRIQPNKSNEAGSKVTIYGFNRGYCYLEVEHYYYISGQPNTISFSSNSICVRIDYRSKELTQRELKSNTEYTYDNMTHYSFDLNFTVVINDHVIQKIGSKKYAVSLLTNKGVTIYDRTGSASNCSVKDYLVYMPSHSPMNKYEVIFSGYDGDVKTYTFDWSSYGVTHCEMNYNQDRRNSNSILLLMSNRNTDEYILQMVDSNGQTTEIYRKRPA